MIPPSRLALEARQGASNRTPRQINRSLVLNQIRTRQPISRADLARTSGLQRSTISTIVEGLLAEGWVVESATGVSARGRKPTHLVVSTRKVVVAVDIHPARTTVALADMSGNISSLRHLDLPSAPRRVIAEIIAAIRKVIADNPGHSFQGIGINLPGRFNRKLERAVFAPNVDWPIAQIKSQVEQALGLAVVVENVANACALSEVWFGYSDASRDIVVINVSEGIGTGIFANGRLLRGNGEGAGEFGHVQVDPNGRPCGCGSRGCWETVASNCSALRYYQEASKRPLASFDDLVNLADDRDAHALAAVERMCRELGRGMHMIVSALAPAEIVVVGEITRLWPLASGLIEAEMRRFPLISVPALRMPTDPDTARLRSAVALVMTEEGIAAERAAARPAR
ncbi:ROK family transcriptional regulator [Acidobacteria bacterium AB60]|nr:ROK family transcriptional regulator [Acidobacteria bacterium AB60]